MDPSRVRQAILSDHVVMRRKLQRLSQAVKRREEPRQLKAIAAELLRQLTLQTFREDHLLLPALRQADMWGPQRAKDLQQHHREQRQEVRALLSWLENDAITREEIRSMTESIISELEQDLRFEEARYLKETLLRDDVVSVGMESG